MDETAEVWQDWSAVDFNCYSTHIDVGAMDGVFFRSKVAEDVQAQSDSFSNLSQHHN